MDVGGAERSGTTVRHKVAAVSLVALVAMGSAVGWKAYSDAHPASGRMCTLAGAIAPEGDTPEEAFALWWAQADHEQLRHAHRDASGHLPPRPTAADFVRDGRNYRWHYAADSWLQVDIDHPREAGVDTSDGWMVIGANACSTVTVTPT